MIPAQSEDTSRKFKASGAGESVMKIICYYKWYSFKYVRCCIPDSSHTVKSFSFIVFYIKLALMNSNLKYVKQKDMMVSKPLSK
jgi:hypothetical protein